MRHYDSGRKADSSSVTQGSVISAGSGFGSAEIGHGSADFVGSGYGIPKVGEVFSPRAGTGWGIVPRDRAQERTRHYRCVACGERASDRHHVIPRAAGGSDDPSNLVWVCRWCHTDRHTNRLEAVYGALRVNVHGWTDVLVPEHLLLDPEVTGGAIGTWCHIVLDRRGYSTIQDVHRSSGVASATIRRHMEALTKAGWGRVGEGIGEWAPGGSVAHLVVSA